jgi:TonB family protein
VLGARLGELHRRLAEAAARCYPTAAQRFRLTGEVPLHFCLDAAGVATALSLEGSTGSALLDRSALECVVAGAQPLSGFEGCFLVPVRFGG